MSEQLMNLDSLLVRNEYKVRIFADYFLNANRFVLSVHDLHLSQLRDLDNLVHRYLKKWLGLPNGASWALVHDVHGLNIKSISHLYMESRALSLSKMRVFGDERVRHALDCKEEREDKWCRKFSSAVYVKGLLDGIVAPAGSGHGDGINQGLDLSQGLLDQFSPLPVEVEEEVAAIEAAASAPGALTEKQLKGKIQAKVQKGFSDFWKEKIGHYTMQGDYLALVMEEGGCVTWKSYLWDIPQGVLKFAMNAGINTLPTGDNLKRWGKRVNDRCCLCGNIQTLLHVLSNCSVALDQGRYTWRHNSVLRTIIDMIRPSLGPDCVLFSDLAGLQGPNGGTIPPDVLVTNLKPDIFIRDIASSRVCIFELTCPWDANISNAHNYKQEKYAPLVADLARHHVVSHYSIEISVRGQVSKENKSRLKHFSRQFCTNSQIGKDVIKCASKASLLASFSLFSARNEPSWNSPNPLIVR
ncbi:MAG: hypothetical protein GWP24_06070 [Alphaproteobacteria bacterium]|nr:hypothetical protein [Alphaproteobacteria bacterium]